jgi:isopenicillin N synthase-like dioxygenase
LLDFLTSGRHQSTPHRVRYSELGDRLSFPFFLDPGWDVQMQRLPITGVVDIDVDDATHRWDGMKLHGCAGTYGDYITQKVPNAFPGLMTHPS